MKLTTTIDLQFGGAGSGCHGENCGRPKTFREVLEKHGFKGLDRSDQRSRLNMPESHDLHQIIVQDKGNSAHVYTKQKAGDVTRHSSHYDPTDLDTVIQRLRQSSGRATEQRTIPLSQPAQTSKSSVSSEDIGHIKKLLDTLGPYQRETVVNWLIGKPFGKARSLDASGVPMEMLGTMMHFKALLDGVSIRSRRKLLAAIAPGGSSQIGRKYYVTDKYGHNVAEYDTYEEASKHAQSRPYSKVTSNPNEIDTPAVRDIIRRRFVKPSTPNVD